MIIKFYNSTENTISKRLYIKWAEKEGAIEAVFILQSLRTAPQKAALKTEIQPKYLWASAKITTENISTGIFHFFKSEFKVSGTNWR